MGGCCVLSVKGCEVGRREVASSIAFGDGIGHWALGILCALGAAIGHLSLLIRVQGFRRRFGHAKRIRRRETVLEISKVKPALGHANRETFRPYDVWHGQTYALSKVLPCNAYQNHSPFRGIAIPRYKNFSLNMRCCKATQTKIHNSSLIIHHSFDKSLQGFIK